MNRLPLLVACLLPLMAGAQTGAPDGGPSSALPPTAPADAGPSPDAGTAPGASAPPAPKAAACPDDEANEDLPAALGALQIQVDGQAQTLSGIEWKGLQRLTREQVLLVTGLPAEGTLTVEQATRGLRRLARSGLFARIAPTLRLAEGGASTLEVTVEEQPYLTSVTFQGLEDIAPDELLADLLHRSRPQPTWTPSEDEDEDVVATLRISERGVSVDVASACPPAQPPREWLARLDARGNLQPGLFLGGLAEGLEYALEEVRDNGYLLARLTATLHPDGRLEVALDEGHIEAVDVEGVEPDMAPHVRAALGVAPGDIFLRSDMSRAVKRLELLQPHLRVEGVERNKRRARIVEERGDDGTRRFHTVREEKKEPRRRRVRVERPWDDFLDNWWDGGDGEDSPKGLVTRGNRVVVHVRARRPSFGVSLLPVHTQVTGLAPGLEGQLRLWDPRNRAHFTLDTAFFVPLRLGGQRIPDEPEQTRRQRRLNWLAGVKAQVPSLGLVELGGQFHDFTDTQDRWRLGAIDSFLYSALLNRPDADYFRRKGAAAFATWRLGKDWLLGAEYRRDTYATLLSLSPPLTVFRQDSPPFPNAPVTEARFGSLIGRLEYASDGTPRRQAGTLFRGPELSLLSQEDDWPHRPTLRGFVTLEVGRPAFGGDEGTDFWKLVSDSALYLPTGDEDSLRLRLRAAGGEKLPLQKREALGGWSALRGYGFKELRGDASVLLSAEYRWDALGAFADLGAVRQEDGWSDARLGLGASLYLGDTVQLTAAWRADDRATLAPELRLLFTRPF